MDGFQTRYGVDLNLKAYPHTNDAQYYNLLRKERIIIKTLKNSEENATLRRASGPYGRVAEALLPNRHPNNTCLRDGEKSRLP